jgi:hypothetical protein
MILDLSKQLEPNHGLTFSQEVFLAIRRGGKLEAVELQNGHIERYTCEPASKTQSAELFSLNKVQPNL